MLLVHLIRQVTPSGQPGSPSKGVCACPPYQSYRFWGRKGSNLNSSIPVCSKKCTHIKPRKLTLVLQYFVLRVLLFLSVFHLVLAFFIVLSAFVGQACIKNVQTGTQGLVCNIIDTQLTLIEFTNSFLPQVSVLDPLDSLLLSICFNCISTVLSTGD